MSKEPRITEADCNEAWAVFSDPNKYQSLNEEQTIMVDAFMDAGQTKKESGEWPTLAEVYENWRRETEEYYRKWIRSYHGPHRLTEKDFVEYEAKLLAAEETDTRLTYMRAAIELKQATGTCPTIDEVRVLWEAKEEKQRAAQKV